MDMTWIFPHNSSVWRGAYRKKPSIVRGCFLTPPASSVRLPDDRQTEAEGSRSRRYRCSTFPCAASGNERTDNHTLLIAARDERKEEEEEWLLVGHPTIISGDGPRHARSTVLKMNYQILLCGKHQANVFSDKLIRTYSSPLYNYLIF